VFPVIYTLLKNLLLHKASLNPRLAAVTHCQLIKSTVIIITTSLVFVYFSCYGQNQITLITRDGHKSGPQRWFIFPFSPSISPSHGANHDPTTLNSSNLLGKLFGNFKQKPKAQNQQVEKKKSRRKPQILEHFTSHAHQLPPLAHTHTPADKPFCCDCSLRRWGIWKEEASVGSALKKNIVHLY